MPLMKYVITCIALLLVGLRASSQESSFSLLQACEYARQHAFSVRNAVYDEEVAKISTEKLIGVGLPQVNASLNYQNFIQLPTSIIPGDVFGAPGEEVRVQFGTSQNLTAGLGLSQLLFDGSWLVGLEASRAYATLKSRQVQLSETQQREAVTQAYFLVLIAGRNASLLEETREIMQRMLEETDLLFGQGLAEEQSVDEFRLALNDLKNRITYARQQEEVATSLLKLQMGYPQQSPMTLTEDLDMLLAASDPQLLSYAFNPDERPEMRVQEGALTMQMLNLKNEKASMLPQLAGFYNLQTQALRNEFNFADGSEPWFPTQVWGIQLNVPIFTGRSNMKAVQQARVEIRRMNDLMTFTREQLLLDYTSARNEYTFATENHNWALENLALSEKILNTSTVKFREGLAGSFEVSEMQRRVVSAQGTFVSSALQLLQARTKLQRALNRL